jgi:hypothetical protein
MLNRKLDTILDPVDAYMHDPMHCLFVDGICNLVLYLLLESCMAAGYTDVYAILSEYIARWRWPSRIGDDYLADIFSKERRDKHRKAKHIKCQASDMMSLMVVVTLFATSVLMKLGINITDECNAWIALADLVDIVIASARIKIEPSKLHTAVETFLERFTAAWGFDWMTPKFHWLLHFTRMLVRFKCLLMCFCLERKHRVAKRYATELTNISKNSSASLLMEVTSHHFSQLEAPASFDFSVGLIDAKKLTKAAQRALARELTLDCTVHDVMCSKVMRYSSLATCAKTDIVLFKHNGSMSAGLVHMHISVDDVPVSLVTVFELVKLHAGTGYAVWKKTDTSLLIEAHAIADVLVTTVLPNDMLGSVVPIEFRV